MNSLKTLQIFLHIILIIIFSNQLKFQNIDKKDFNFRILAFYTGKNDMAHISYVNEANHYFDSLSLVKHFEYQSTSDWNKMNFNELSKYDIILFLDTRPENSDQREAFQKYMEKGGGWIGFHFSAFALDKSTYENNWSWYHNIFLGSGDYKSNTWRPTSAVLKRIVKNKYSPQKFLNTSPNEWYAWQNDLRNNKDIEILYAIDERSFPLGIGPKKHEIWTEGFYPIIWKNKNYNMIYSNIGHNDMDYEHKYEKDSVRTLSQTFKSKDYSDFILNAFYLLAKEKKRRFAEK